MFDIISSKIVSINDIAEVHVLVAFGNEQRKFAFPEGTTAKEIKAELRQQAKNLEKETKQRLREKGHKDVIAELTGNKDA